MTNFEIEVMVLPASDVDRARRMVQTDIPNGLAAAVFASLDAPSVR